MPVHDIEVHDKVKIAAITPYGCSNAKREIGYFAQNGWNVGGTRRMVEIFDWSSSKCRYDARPTDPRCGECRLPSDEDYLRSYGK